MFRIKPLKSLIIIAAQFLLICAMQPSFAQNLTPVERPDDELLILGLEINGQSRSEGVFAYQPPSASPNEILLPMQGIFNALSAAIEVQPLEGTAEGFFLREDRVFRLDIPQKKITLGSYEFPLPSDAVEVQVDDIYVNLKYLREWFNLDIDYQPTSLTLSITSEEALPFQEQAERQARADLLLTEKRKPDFDPKEAYLLPYGMFSSPYIVYQQSLSGQKSPNESLDVQTTSNVMAGFDLLRFGGDLNLTYRADNDGFADFVNSSLTFTRASPKNDLLGPLDAGRIQVGDVDFTSVPLIGGGQRGAGVKISSEAGFGVKLTQQLGTLDIDGDGPVDWDVELYRNGQFIAFQTVGTNGRYLFENITLISGFNRFQILLFGPEGQRREITEDVFSGPNLLSEGEVVYNLSAGAPQADFLPLPENARDDYNFGVSGDLFYGVNDFLTIGGHVYHGPDGDDDLSAADASVSTAFLGFNNEAKLLLADGGRYAYQLSTRKRFRGVNAAASHIVYENFDQDEQIADSVSELTLSKNFDDFNVSMISEYQSNQDGTYMTTLENIVSTELFGLKLTNDLIKVFSDDENRERLDGDLEVLSELYDFRVRSNLLYDFESDDSQFLRSFRVNALRYLSGGSSLRLGGIYDFINDDLFANARYSREFDKFSLDFDVSASTQNSYFAGVTFRTSFQPRESGYEMVSPNVGTLATLGVFAYVDENGNNEYDNGERPLDNVTFRSTRSEVKGTTNEDGVAFLYGLAETPTRIAISEEELQDIYIVPNQKGVDLIPRRGAGGVVDFPFSQLGEIDGFLLAEGTQEPLANLPIRLIDLESGEEYAETYSEYDGYYIFSGLPLGNYQVVSTTGWFEDENGLIKSDPISVSADNSNVMDVTLQLPEVDDLMASTDSGLAANVTPILQMPQNNGFFGLRL